MVHVRTVIALLSCMFATCALAAEIFPSRPIRMMVPFPAGGPADFVGRLFAQRLTALLNQQIVIDNRGGAGGVIGTETAVHANPDGYTLLFGSTSTFAINQVLMKDLPYDVFRDLSLIGLVANAPHVLAVRESLPAKSVRELIALAKQQPGKYTFASAGTGTIVQMGGELFKYYAGIDILHIPFKGGAPATIGLLAGEVDMVVNDLSTLLPHIKSGKLRALAAAHTRRLAPLPYLPTFAELGMPNIVSSTWWGIAVPAKTPAAIRTQIATAHNAVLTEAGYVKQLADVAMEPLVLTSAETTEFIRRETDKWRKVATAAKIAIN